MKITKIARIDKLDFIKENPIIDHERFYIIFEQTIGAYAL